MQINKLHHYWPTVIAAIASIQLSAQTEEVDTAEANLLPEYIVSANSYKMERSQVGSTVHKLSRSDLEKGQTTFLIDAIRELPGVYLRNNGGPGATIGMTTRGINYSQQQPLVLLDGVEVNNPADGFMLNLGNVFTNQIESVEFLKGAQSSLYGADAHSGIISLKSRDNADGTALSVNNGFGTFNSRSSSVQLQIKKDKIGLMSNYSFYSSDGFSARSGNSEKDGYKNKSLLTHVKYQVNEKTQLFANLNVIESDAEYDTGATDSIGDHELDQISISTGIKSSILENWDSIAQYNLTEIRSTSIGSWGTSESDADRHELTIRNSVNIIESWNLAAGGSYRKEDYRSGSDDRHNFSIYLDNHFAVTPDIDMTIGGRSDRNNVYGNNNTWRTSFSYRLHDLGTRLHGSCGTSFDAPTFAQLYGQWGANPNLKPEKGTAWDLGIEKNLFKNRALLDLTLFYNDISEKIAYTSQYVNLDKYKSHGFETSFRYSLNSSYQLSANYTYSRGKESGTNLTPVRVPKHLANIALNYNPMSGKLNIRPSYQYVSKRNDVGGIAKSYSLVNIAAEYDLHSNISIWTRISNLLDKNYQEVYGYNTSGLNIMSGFKLEF